MKCKLIYQFVDGDSPSPKYIIESFNLLAEFAPELREESNELRKAFNRVTKNQEFDHRDFADLVQYGKAVADRALERYETGKAFESAPWRESVMQNVRRMLATLAGLQNLRMGSTRGAI